MNQKHISKFSTRVTRWSVINHLRSQVWCSWCVRTQHLVLRKNNSGNFRVGSGGAQSQWEGNLQQRVSIDLGGTNSCTEGLLDAVEMNYIETCLCVCFHLLHIQRILTQAHTAVCYPWTIKTMSRAETWHSQRCSQIMLHRLKTCRSFPGWYKLLIDLISHVAQMLVNVTMQKHLYKAALINLFHHKKKKLI